MADSSLNSSSTHRIQFGFYDSRKNLPAAIARKRGESNFLCAFEKVYFERSKNSKKYGIAASEFAMQHLGRADLIWISWNPFEISEDFSAIALHRQLRRRKLVAFEAKLKNWKKGLQQAYRYRYFADKSILVMPADSIEAASSNLHHFKELEVGLWSFDKVSGKINEVYSPNDARAISKEVRENAISMITSKISKVYLSKIRKHLDAVTKRV